MNQDQSDLQNPSTSSSTSIPASSIPQSHSLQTNHQTSNQPIMKDDELYQYLYNPNRSENLNTLSIFLKNSTSEHSNSIQTLLHHSHHLHHHQPSKGEFYQAWLRSHSISKQSSSSSSSSEKEKEINSNPHQIDPTNFSEMEIDQVHHHPESHSIDHHQHHHQESHSISTLTVDVEMLEN